MGRPSNYDIKVKPFFEKIKAALNRGVEENKIAASLGVSVPSWCEYKNRFPEFAELFKIDEDATKQILDRLDSALMKCAEGYFYEEEKQYITEDEDGRQKKHIEKFKKYNGPNPTAIFGAYNRFDPDYVKDKAYYKLKCKELQLKKSIAECSNFGLKIEDITIGD